MEVKGDLSMYKAGTERLLNKIEDLKTEEEVSKWLQDFSYYTSNLHNQVIKGKKTLQEKA